MVDFQNNSSILGHLLSNDQNHKFEKLLYIDVLSFETLGFHYFIPSHDVPFLP